MGTDARRILTPGDERPPSERGIQYDLLAAIEGLGRQLEELGRRPAPNFVNWWDVLPPELPDLQSGPVWWLQLPTKRMTDHLALEAHPMEDRLELRLKLNGGHMLWQRALFFAGKLPVSRWT